MRCYLFKSIIFFNNFLKPGKQLFFSWPCKKFRKYEKKNFEVLRETAGFERQKHWSFFKFFTHFLRFFGVVMCMWCVYDVCVMCMWCVCDVYVMCCEWCICISDTYIMVYLTCMWHVCDMYVRVCDVYVTMWCNFQSFHGFSVQNIEKFLLFTYNIKSKCFDL